MRIDTNLLSDHTWNGTFFPPGRQDLAFGGRLNYSPVDGLRLGFSIPRDTKLEKGYRMLHGVVDGGIPCTLVGAFESYRFGWASHFGQDYFTSDKYPFLYVLFGLHCEEETTFHSFQFDITGFQEFACPEGARKHTQFQKGTIFRARSPEGVFEAHHTGTFDFLPRDIRSVIHASDDAALSELQKAIDSIRSKHPHFHPWLKLSLEYRFTYTPLAPQPLVQAYQACARLADLFSLMYFGPAKLREFHAIAIDESGHSHLLPAFPATPMEKDALDRCVAARSFHHMPLNLSQVNLPNLIENWSGRRDEFRTLVSLQQSKGSWASSHAILSGIVLSATQLEDIAFTSGKGKDQKFAYGVINFASPELQIKLGSLLSCATDDIGEAISTLRNEIAHVGRPKKLLASLSTRDLYRVSVALEAIVCGYALEAVGLEKAARAAYQNRLDA